MISKNQEIPIPFKIQMKSNRFEYLGVWISRDLNPDYEIKSRIEQARQGMRDFFLTRI